MKKLVLVLLSPILSFATVSNGPYVGIEAGLSNQIMINNGNSYSNANGATTRLNIGYNLDKMNGLEIAGNYGFGGDFNINGQAVPAKYSSVDASYIINLPTVFNGFSVFGRVGAAYDWINSSGSCNCSSNTSISGGNITDELGAGVKYNLTSKTAIRLEWIENGLIFPIGVSDGTQSGNWTNQTFITGFNVSF